jgi:hypothetical protein
MFCRALLFSGSVFNGNSCDGGTYLRGAVTPLPLAMWTTPPCALLMSLSVESMRLASSNALLPISPDGLSTLYSAAGYSYTSSDGPEIEDDEVILKIDPQNEIIIKAIIDSFNTNFALETTDDDEEFIQPIVELNKALRKFKKFDNVYTYEWDDLDDLIGLSKVWPFTLSFED